MIHLLWTVHNPLLPYKSHRTRRLVSLKKLQIYRWWEGHICKMKSNITFNRVRTNNYFSQKVVKAGEEVDLMSKKLVPYDPIASRNQPREFTQNQVGLSCFDRRNASYIRFMYTNSKSIVRNLPLLWLWCFEIYSFWNAFDEFPRSSYIIIKCTWQAMILTSKASLLYLLQYAHTSKSLAAWLLEIQETWKHQWPLINVFMSSQDVPLDGPIQEYLRVCMMYYLHSIHCVIS